MGDTNDEALLDTDNHTSSSENIGDPKRALEIHINNFAVDFENIIHTLQYMIQEARERKLGDNGNRPPKTTTSNSLTQDTSSVTSNVQSPSPSPSPSPVSPVNSTGLSLDLPSPTTSSPTSSPTTSSPTSSQSTSSSPTLSPSVSPVTSDTQSIASDTQSIASDRSSVNLNPSGTGTQAIPVGPDINFIPDDSPITQKQSHIITTIVLDEIKKNTEDIRQISIDTSVFTQDESNKLIIIADIQDNLVKELNILNMLDTSNTVELDYAKDLFFNMARNISSNIDLTSIYIVPGTSIVINKTPHFEVIKGRIRHIDVNKLKDLNTKIGEFDSDTDKIKVLAEIYIQSKEIPFINSSNGVNLQELPLLASPYNIDDFPSLSKGEIEKNKMGLLGKIDNTKNVLGNMLQRLKEKFNEMKSIIESGPHEKSDEDYQKLTIILPVFLVTIYDISQEINILNNLNTQINTPPSLSNDNIVKKLSEDLTKYNDIFINDMINRANSIIEAINQKGVLNKNNITPSSSPPSPPLPPSPASPASSPASLSQQDIGEDIQKLITSLNDNKSPDISSLQQMNNEIIKQHESLVGVINETNSDKKTTYISFNTKIGEILASLQSVNYENSAVTINKIKDLQVLLLELMLNISKCVNQNGRNNPIYCKITTILSNNEDKLDDVNNLIKNIIPENYSSSFDSCILLINQIRTGMSIHTNTNFINPNSSNGVNPDVNIVGNNNNNNERDSEGRDSISSTSSDGRDSISSTSSEGRDSNISDSSDGRDTNISDSSEGRDSTSSFGSDRTSINTNSGLRLNTEYNDIDEVDKQIYASTSSAIDKVITNFNELLSKINNSSITNNGYIFFAEKDKLSTRVSIPEIQQVVKTNIDTFIRLLNLLKTNISSFNNNQINEINSILENIIKFVNPFNDRFIFTTFTQGINELYVKLYNIVNMIPTIKNSIGRSRELYPATLNISSIKGGGRITYKNKQRYNTKTKRIHHRRKKNYYY
jgi:hypothetical protein